MKLFWPVLALMLACGLAVSESNRRTSDALAIRTDQAFHFCAQGLERTSMELYRVEYVMVDMLQRLGLDRNYMPLLNTLAFRKAVDGVTVREARKRLNAPEVYEEGARLEDVVAPGWGGIGGPDG